MTLDTVRPYDRSNDAKWLDVFRHDSRLRFELDVCAAGGVPHSIFLGRVWPNPIDPTEPQWSDDDREIAVAYAKWKAGICPGCGTHPLEWARDEDGFIDEQDPSFEPDVVVCIGCRSMEQHRKHEMGKDAAAKREYRVILKARKRDVDKSEEELDAEALADWNRRKAERVEKARRAAEGDDEFDDGED